MPRSEHGAGDRTPGAAHAAFTDATRGERDGATESAPHPLSIHTFEASPTSLGSDGGDVHLRYTVTGASSLRLVCEQDGAELCGTAPPCPSAWPAAEAELVAQPRYEKTSYRLEASDGAATVSARVEIALERPRFPDVPYNDLSIWMLAHRPIRAPFTFVVINDSQPATDCPVSEPPAYVELRARVAELAPDFVLSIGDVVLYGQACEWEPYLANTLHHFVDELGIPWITTIGNHELYNGRGDENFAAFVGAQDFAFDVDSVRFVSLNVVHPGALQATDAQRADLAERLATASLEGIADVVLAMHYPPFTPSTAGACGHFLLNRYEGRFEQRYAYQGAAELLEVVESVAPTLTMGLYGHVHVFGHYTRAGVHHVVSGGGGGHLCAGGEYDARADVSAEAPYQDGIFHHFLHVTVRSDQGRDLAVQVHKLGELEPVQGYGFEL